MVVSGMLNKQIADRTWNGGKYSEGPAQPGNGKDACGISHRLGKND